MSDPLVSEVCVFSNHRSDIFLENVSPFFCICRVNFFPRFQSLSVACLLSHEYGYSYPFPLASRVETWDYSVVKRR